LKLLPILCPINLWPLRIEKLEKKSLFFQLKDLTEIYSVDSITVSINFSATLKEGRATSKIVSNGVNRL
jgi:hypothetical protein